MTDFSKILTGAILLIASSSFAVDFSTQVSCKIYPAGAAEIDLQVPASFTSNRAPTVSKDVTSGVYKVSLIGSGGGGGEPGTVQLEIKRNGSMVVKTLWQAGDSMSIPNQRTGLNYIVQDDSLPGGAEIQYTCASK